ncbi:AraC family transcriptional regulator [Costertonia aggregata]|uniref:AraC family transcriptional regulator n=1 Tax=Costertonia aggregata TaxID=343403 RepID=A0A7H9AQQ2_9FLAO|nr:AraC family transcriptional regulator [Costertonia aggregata]QLG45756.1 AraC family transcriptional regulator [Costertonia aggregata]
MKYCIVFVLLVFANFKSTSQELEKSIPKTDSVAEKQATYYVQKLTNVYHNGEYDEHKAYSDSLYALAKENGLVKFQILGRVNQAVYYKNRGKQDKSLTLYREALELTKAIPEDYRTKIIILVNLGNIYVDIEAHPKAIQTLENVLELLEKHEKNPKIEAAALNGLSNSYDGLGNMDKALEYLMRSKELGEEIKNERIIATALNNISEIKYYQKNYQEAVSTGNKALELEYTRENISEKASALLHIGAANIKLNNIALAVAQLEEANAIAIDKKLPEIELFCQKFLGEAYLLQNEVEKASEAERTYLSLKNNTLKVKDRAVRLDLEKDLTDKNNIISRLKNNNNTWIVRSLVLTAILFVTCLLFYLYQRRIRRTQEKIQHQFIGLGKNNVLENNNTKKSEYRSLNPETTSSYKNSSLTKDLLEEYKECLIQFTKANKPYLNSELSQSELASQLGMSSYHLSEVLNSGFDQNFYNFINSYKVLEAQKLMRSKSHKDSKLLAIAFDSGFKSKTSFNRIFKNHTGKTPSEYRKNLTQ